ncbi:MAG: hypothetical protein IJH63_01605 [Methanobrevibacter sp.]|nr:hypothetical protein [Bacilli bacterium]MBR0369403.1 hypothetical protein [Methanobrevibacter sp.]
MLIILILISIAIIILGLFVYPNDEEIGTFITGAGIIGFIIKIIGLICCISSLVGARVIDQRIELYQNKNKEIEEKMEIVVKNYMEYEGNTYKELKTDSYIQLINLYPDLKADQLVKQQINLYIENNNKIIQLKEEKMNKTIYRWWVYFGK